VIVSQILLLTAVSYNLFLSLGIWDIILSDDLSDDDDDIRREIKNLFVRTNMLISRFYKCFSNVKLTRFKSFCMAVYDVALWKKVFSCCFQ